MDRSMCPTQRESGLPIVIEAPALPTIWIVTASAVLAELASMAVLRTMAIDASRTGFAEVGRHVAVVAGRELVEAEQWESGQIVIDGLRLPPGEGRVTLLATTPLGARVNVDRSVAVDAESRRPGIRDRRRVTKLAVQLRVSTIETERRCLRVVEMRACPRSCVVTSAAIGAVSTLVLVVLRVTARAGRFEFLELRIPRVTATALQPRVRTTQRKAGLLVVIEALALPP